MDEHQKPSWVDYFMSLALSASMRSKDPKTQVGCVIVDSTTLKILSIGYNGFPPGISNSGKNWSVEEKKDLVVHAEANAVLLKGGANLENSIAFVTLFPCEDCAKMLIQAGVLKVYYLSFRDKYRKSEVIFKAANVDLVPLKRGDDGTLTIFQNRLINMFKATIQNVCSTVPDDTSTQVYNRLKEREEIKDLMKKDIEGAWQRGIEPGQRSDKILFKQWKDYFLFLALVAGVRSSSGAKEGALLVDSKTLKICSLGYKGYPRGVEGTPNDAMMVSAIINVLALRFCEGNNFYAFSTNFPKEGEVKNLAQAKVERLYFINPTNMTEKAQSTLKAAGVETVPMDLLKEEDIEEEIRNAFEGLAVKERENKVPFKQWPKIQWTPYELEPKRRNIWFGATTKNIAIGIAIGLAIGAGIWIGTSR